LDDLAVVDKTYKISFDSTDTYNVLDSTGVSYDFTSKGLTLVALRHKNIVEESIKVRDASNAIVPSENYAVNSLRGQIGAASEGSLPAGEKFTISYMYYPVYGSNLVNSEDGNEVFDGIRVFVQEDQLNINLAESRFITNSNISVIDNAIFPPILGGNKIKVRADWEVRWNNTDTLADGSWNNADTLSTLLGDVAAPFTLWYVEEKAPSYYFEEPANIKILPALDL
jgi:hypothetical protein